MFITADIYQLTSLHSQVMRHERASTKADIWSYGILIWELVSGRDITEHEPLALTRARTGPGTPRGKPMTLPPGCSPIAARVFAECTRMSPDARPQAQDVVEWLREA